MEFKYNNIPRVKIYGSKSIKIYAIYPGYFLRFSMQKNQEPLKLTIDGASVT